MSSVPMILPAMPRRAALLATLVSLLVATAAAYAPGLSGPFLFDDFANLTGLGVVAAERSLEAVGQYVFGGISSVLGRPLALATFAAQSGSWPEAPGAFLRVNLALHLLNGALLFGLARALQRAQALPPGLTVAGFACAFWLLTPLQMTAVLYVVQRMTLLATTFVLAGTWLYVSGRIAGAAGAAGLAYRRMSAGVVLGLGLGTLSKESAAVLPLLLLAVEATVLRSLPRPPGYRTWAAAFLALPSALLLGYLVLRLPTFLAEYSGRGFTLGERLLTEPRVLFAYLRDALLPRPGSVRLLHDDLVISTAAWQPWTTAVALAAWTAVIGVAVRARRRAPLVALAVAWFLVAHLLESSVIALELAFQHRNYTPLVGVALALGALPGALAQRAARLRRLAHAGAAAYAVLLAACVWLAASLWGQPLEQARQWTLRQPDSARALHYYALKLLQGGELGAAAGLYDAGSRRWPHDPVMALSRYALGCFHPDLATSGQHAFEAIAAYRGSEGHRAVGVVRDLGEYLAAGHCPHRRPEEALALIDAMLAAPGFGNSHLLLHHAAALLLDHQGHKEAALARLDRALALDTQVPLLQQGVLWSLQLGDVARARAYLGLAEGPRLGARTRWRYRAEIEGARRLIEAYESLPPGSAA